MEAKARVIRLDPASFPSNPVHVMAPMGSEKNLRLGQQVRVVAWLDRYFDEDNQIRGWERVEPIGGPVDGVIVGLRTVYSGLYVPSRRYGDWFGVNDRPAHLCDLHPHRAVLVAVSPRSRHRYALTDDVDIIDA